MARRFSRKHSLWVGGLAVLLLLSIAVPSFAAPNGTKYYSFTVSPSPVAAGTQNQVFYVTITNSSPQGSSSNFSSASVHVPSQFTVVSARIDPTKSTNANASAVVTINSSSATCQYGGSQDVNVCSLDPVKRTQYVTLAITTNVTDSGLACGNGNTSDPWTVIANTGSQLNGNNFDPNPGQLPVTTAIGFTCSLSFSPATPDGTSGTGANDGVTATIQTSPATSGADVTLTVTKPSGATVTIDGTTGTTATKTTGATGAASFLIKGDTVGTYGLSADGGTTFGTATDDTYLYEGILDCADTVAEDTSGATAYRGPNKDGSNCQLVPYTFSSSFTQSSATIEFLWDQASQPNAQYKFTIPWPESSNDNPATPAVTTYTIGNLVDEPIQYCDGMSGDVNGVSVNLGTLTANSTAGTTTLTVDTTGAAAAPPAPFDVFVGNEWFRVLSTDGSTWNVQAGYGGTSPSAHASGDAVLLALPIYPSGQQACLSNTTTVGTGTGTQTTEEIWLKGDATITRAR